MLNKYISMISGFTFGYGLIVLIMSGNWNFIVSIIGAALIAYCNFTGKGELKYG